MIPDCWDDISIALTSANLKDFNSSSNVGACKKAGIVKRSCETDDEGPVNHKDSKSSSNEGACNHTDVEKIPHKMIDNGTDAVTSLDLPCAEITEKENENKIGNAKNIEIHSGNSENCRDKIENSYEPKSKVPKLGNMESVDSSAYYSCTEKTITEIRQEHSLSSGHKEKESVQSVYLSPSKDIINLVQDIIKDRSCIVDLDLDFFSTKNPFKEMYGEEQYKLLQDLYRYERPKSLSDEVSDKLIWLYGGSMCAIRACMCLCDRNLKISKIPDNNCKDLVTA